MTGRRFRQDDGAMLVIAMVVVTAVALVVGAVLTRGDGSIRATVALRQVAGSTYAADGAAQIAINDLRTGAWLGSAPKPTGWGYDNDPFDGCFGRDNVGAGPATSPIAELNLNGFYPAADSQSGPTSAVVKCTPEDATGQQGSPVAVNNSNKPGNAILTLGTSAAEDGFKFKTNGTGGAFRVRGGIWSNSTIVRDNNGQLQSTESIRARSGCTPAEAMSAPIIDCSAASAPDPNYPSELDVTGGGVPPLQVPPTNCSSGSVTLTPGYYDDADRLDALTPNGGSGCFIHFNPGIYYFDFHNNTVDPMYQAGIAGNTGDVWDINSGVLVGGKLTSDTTIPGRCVSPIDDPTPDQGVQFIFGGDSRLAVDKGAQVELCGSYHSTRPPIAVYGQKTGTTAPLSTMNGLTIGSAPPTVSPASSWIKGTTGSVAPTASDLVAQDGNVASFKRSGGTNTAVITAAGFTPTSTIPAGAVLTGATVRVGYTETNGSNASLAITPSGGPAITGFNLPTATPAPQPFAANLATLNSSGFGTLQAYVHDHGLAGASIAFTASPKSQGDTTTLDSLQLDLTYYLPALRGETTTAIPGNTVATPGGSPLVMAQGNTTVFYTQGTTYAPLASLYLALNNISESVFRFGVIARSLNVFETASFSYPGAVIELPDNSPGWGFNGTLVQLQVYLCPDSPTCSVASGTLALKSRVQIWDPTGIPVPNQRQLSVLSWSHQR